MFRRTKATSETPATPPTVSRNDAIAAIDEANQRSLEFIEQFRAATESGAADPEEMARLKRKHPFIGFVPCRAQGIDFALFTANDDVVAWDYLWWGEDAYETDIVATWVSWCRTPGTVYDIGGYTGLMSILAAKANRDNQVHLFEPMERTIDRAKVNIRANKVARRVELHTRAASDQPGEARINLYRKEHLLGTGNSVYDKGLPVYGFRTITSVRIDDELPGGTPSVVKVDVEGHELAALRGMEQTVRRSRPRMIVEIWEHNRDELLALLADWGYQCTPFENPDLRVVNYACVPSA